MIYVTHDQIEAMTLADRIVLLRDGRIEQLGPPLDLFERPATHFVAGFLGTPKMNFIPAFLGAGGCRAARPWRRRSDQASLYASAIERRHSRCQAAAYRHCARAGSGREGGRASRHDRARAADRIAHAHHLSIRFSLGSGGSGRACPLQARRQGQTGIRHKSCSAHRSDGPGGTPEERTREGNHGSGKGFARGQAIWN